MGKRDKRRIGYALQLGVDDIIVSWQFNAQISAFISINCKLYSINKCRRKKEADCNLNFLYKFQQRAIRTR